MLTALFRRCYIELPFRETPKSIRPAINTKTRQSDWILPSRQLEMEVGRLGLVCIG
jgi:hypothetical protein